MQPRLFTGVIQFPSTVDSLESIPVYHAGRRIVSRVEEQSHRITFTVPDSKTIFYLIMTTAIDFVCQDNLVHYLTLNPSVACKVYVLELTGSDTPSGRFSLALHEKTGGSLWHIREVTPPTPNARIPDDSIIVWLDPAWIARIEKGNSVEFPRIIIRPDLAAFVGSAQKNSEKIQEWLVASLDLNGIHGAIEQAIQMRPQSKTVLAFNW